MVVITLKKRGGKKCLESLNWYEFTEILLNEGGLRVCGDAALQHFWCGVADIFVLICGFVVLYY